ncbi:hypothetical protein Tco_0316959 [Tanacetum coccineum]
MPGTTTTSRFEPSAPSIHEEDIYHEESDLKRQDIVQAVHVCHSKAAKAQENLPELGKLCWWKELREGYKDFYGEPNDDIFSVASRTSCVTQAGSPPSTCQTISNIDAHVEGEQFHESKQSRVIRIVKVSMRFPRSRQSQRDLPRDNSLVSVEVLSSNTISEVALFEVSGKEILASTVNLMHLR